MRIEQLRGEPVARGQAFTFQWDGAPINAYSGETILGALLASGIRTLRHTSQDQPRGMLCGIGVCYDCLVTIDGQRNQRACMTPAQPGMVVRSEMAAFSE